MTMRVNDVTMISIAGANDKIVRISRICRLTDTSCGPLAASTPMFNLGTIGSADANVLK